MEYRVANVIVDSEENIVYEGENVKVTFDDGSVVCGTVESIFDREKRVTLNCKHFDVNIGIDKITNITKG